MRYLVIDIETVSPDAAHLTMEEKLLKPSANIKDPKKKEANLAQKKITMRDKAALLDSAPIACIGIKAPEETYLFGSFNIPDEDSKILASAGMIYSGSDDEEGMLTNYAAFLDLAADEDTDIVTYNGVHFDIPRIRFRYANYGLAIPAEHAPYRRSTDLMMLYSKYFSMSNTPFVSLSEVIIKLGICKDGKLMSGAMFGQLIDEGEYLKALLYNALDCLLTEQVYFRLCG